MSTYYFDQHGKPLTPVEIVAAKSGQLDYQAYDADLEVSIYETQGRRYSQEDRVVFDFIDELSGLDVTKITRLLKNTITKLQTLSEQYPFQGSTFIASVVIENKILTAQVGDSSAYIAIFDSHEKLEHFERLNKMLHNPDALTEEGQRAASVARKNNVSLPYRKVIWRLGDGLALSRSLGDVESEPYGLIHDPDISVFEVPNQKRRFLILGCDGLTEKMSEEQLKSEVQNFPHLPEKDLAKSLVAAALRSYSGDNVSVIVAALSPTLKRPRLFAIFDGHGGSAVADLLCHHFLDLLKQEIKISGYAQRRNL